MTKRSTKKEINKRIRMEYTKWLIKQLNMTTKEWVESAYNLND